MRERLIVFGASNAAGWSEGPVVDYHCSKIASAVYDKAPVVTETPERVVIDLSQNPELEEGANVLNEGFPGDTVWDLEGRFRTDVLEQEPTRLFFWSGLNDISIAVMVLSGREEDKVGLREDPAAERLSRVFRKLGDTDSYISEASGIIFGKIRKMVAVADKKRIQTFVGTLPSYGSRLLTFQDNLKEPLAPHFKKEGLALIGLINGQIREFRGQNQIVDAYRLTVDETTGLVQAQFSYGETVSQFSGDILHLNSFGQIQVAANLCAKIFRKPVVVIPPDKSKTDRWGAIKDPVIL